MKWVYVTVLVGIICLIVGYNLAINHSNSAQVIAQDASPEPSPSPSFSSSFGQNSNQPSPTPQDTTEVFNYSPLPTNRGGPENDVEQTAPISVSRNTAQVDDYITFTTTIQNVA